MYSLQQVENAYFKENPVLSRTPTTEQGVIRKVTDDLRQASKHKQRDYPAFVQALDRNRKLWVMLASDVAEPGNALPAKLRAQIFYLAEFVIQHTRKVLQDAEHEAPLIEVNEIILLRGTQGDRQ